MTGLSDILMNMYRRCSDNARYDPTCMYSGLYHDHVLVGYLSLVRRIKAGTMWKNSVLYAFCRFFRIFWRNRNVVWRMVVSGVILIGIHWMLALFIVCGIFVDHAGASYAFIVIIWY